ncbi:1-aminocyclopropane-1-carboxylate deaminase/D-cysteine desulfhydrase, PLP-dependent ACC family [Bradyrhizobium erythrophlei]|jgi:1-aminocyclopropane-1-carboxylate deaminase/D-cysteine desulfhydrase-like pyridoxal-dependent ACC family enzyme|uniref:1-aminocyclopropane-1-carboxylate deaminase/D-cysteine desulfhydrase, PLP-dependent ACC family n=1 Tax=Bradyrhizobium erythrophlei TaxID=1437360 RepID=A0A1M5VIC4_9BRAD|nr:1-aminocyclopropane-1-carboxylate deaminase/D-cysteine desulfhydrase, PLP-dependent ACC family [Bradyrhizobium erythrophlei]
MQGALLGGAALSVVGMTQSRRPIPPFPQIADVSGLAPPSAALNSQSLALGKLFPSLADPDATEGPFIVNTLSCKDSFAGYIRRGEPGNSVFLSHADARATIPWAPIFVRQNNLLQLPSSVTRQIDCSEVLVMNESSAHYPVFGNKARKYEFLLPNLKWSGAQRLGTMGAVSSNHALQFALANRVADLTGDGQPLNCALDLVLFEVPGAATDMARLAILRSLVQHIAIASNDVELVGEAGYEYAKHWLHPDTDSLVPPGGSNEVSVLGHMNAIAELAQLLDAAQAWKAPPDVIFVAMGSGSTVLGLLLGVHLMGWNTKVVGVADQDKSYLTRWLLNRQPSVPFVEGNVAQLARSTVEWLQKIRFPGISPDVLRVMQQETFVPDSTSWEPGYGLIEPADGERANELKEAGLTLDPVFTLKAWRSLLTMSQTGALKNKKVLFWNTYNSFDYMPPLQSSLG